MKKKSTKKRSQTYEKPLKVSGASFKDVIRLAVGAEPVKKKVTGKGKRK